MIIRYTISEADRKRSKRNVVGCGFYRGGFLFPEAPDAAVLVRDCRRDVGHPCPPLFSIESSNLDTGMTERLIVIVK